MSLCIRLNEWDLECINWAIQLTSQSFWLHIPPFLKLSIDFLGIALVVKNRIIHTCHWFRVVFGILWLLLLLCVLLFLEKRLIFLHQDVLGITVTNLTKKKVLTMCFTLQEAILGYIEPFLGYVPQFLGNSLMFSHEILCISSSLHSDGHYEKKIFGSCATCRLFWLCFSV